VLSLNTYYYVNDSLPIVVAAGLTNVVLKVTTQNWNPTSVTLLGGMTNAATLTVYDTPSSSGGSVSLGGNNIGGAIAATPVNFIFYGLPNLTSISFHGSAAFIGAIYAPEADLSVGGGGSSSDFMGSAIIKSMTMHGHYDYHYDEALATLGPVKGYVVSSWQEL
jgi:choice-of-anchor A domain-containing protein